MNTGIQDAVSLGNALHHAISAGDDTVLDQWETERLKIAHSVVDLTDRLTRLATLSSPVLKFVRNIAVELLGSLPFAQHAMAETLAELSHR
jgi:2-polyprenyl-6-methoxyphenol hydroxylase-like FAD-dependent oxidoreductase